MKDEIDVWRLVVDNVTTLHEIEAFWSYDDVMRANAVLDLKESLEQHEMKVRKPKLPKR